MKAVVQRVLDASVTVDGTVKGCIARGLLVYLGVVHDDAVADADWLAEKIINLRIFDDSDGKMNISLVDLINQSGVNHNNQAVNDTDVNHEPPLVNKLSVNRDFQPVNITGVLAVSQFTLLGDARKGRRPSWGKAAPPEKARELYVYFMKKIRESVPCESGEFQAHMMVRYTNDGPVTILLDSKDEVFKG